MLVNEPTQSEVRFLPSGVSLLHVATVPAPLRNFLIPYAAHFRALGWRVDAAAHGCTSVEPIAKAFDGVYELPFSRSVLHVRSLIESESAVRNLIYSISPDIIHLHTPIASFVTRLAVRRMPAKRRPAIVYTAHGFHFHHGGNPVTNMAFLTAERVVGRWTDRLVVINDEDEEAVIHNRIVPLERMTRMPGIGIDTRWYSRSTVPLREIEELRERLRIPPGAPLFVMVAEMARNKRHDDVLAALVRVARSDAHLILAGDGRERSRLEGLAFKLGIGDRVHFQGFVQDVRPMLAAAVALVLASHREGLPRSIMESLAMETPVIASDARGIRELVEPDAGIIFPVGDVKALATGLNWLIDHPIEREGMGARGRERIVREDDLEILIELHERMYEELLEGRVLSNRRVMPHKLQ